MRKLLLVATAILFVSTSAYATSFKNLREFSLHLAGLVGRLEAMGEVCDNEASLMIASGAKEELAEIWLDHGASRWDIINALERTKGAALKFYGICSETLKERQETLSDQIMKETAELLELHEEYRKE